LRLLQLRRLQRNASLPNRRRQLIPLRLPKNSRNNLLAGRRLRAPSRPSDTSHLREHIFCLSERKVTDGQYQFEVSSSQLTNDLDMAASVAQSDYAEQVRITELTGKLAQEYARQQREAFIASEKERAQKKTRPRPTPQAPR